MKLGRVTEKRRFRLQTNTRMSALGWRPDIDQQAESDNPKTMIRVALILCLACAACGVAKQPRSAKTIAAYEVPLPAASDKRRFLAMLSERAKAAGFHVDAATTDELKATSEVSPQTFSATVWRGKDDAEPIASAMDFQDHLGRVWISFSVGENPARSRQFRDTLMPAIRGGWPGTASLPIMPNGAIPLTQDLIHKSNGYIVNPSAAIKYEARANE